MIPQSCPDSSPSFIPSFIPAEPVFIPFAPVEHRIPFSRVPRTLLNAPGITLRDIKVYAAILSFPANARHERWPGREKIGELTGLPPKVVSRTTTHLQKLGWLAKQGDGGRSRTTRYVIFDRAQPPEVIATWEWLPLPSRKRKPSSKQPRKQRTNSAQTAPVSTPQTAPQTAPVSMPDSDVNSAQTVPNSTPESALNSPRFGEGQVVQQSDAAQKTECSEPAASNPARPLPLSAGSRKEKTPAPDTVPDAWIDTAIEMRPDLTADQIARSAAKFLNHHKDQHSEFKEWLPIWRIWISKERPDSRKGPLEARTATQADRRYPSPAQEQALEIAKIEAIAASEERRIAMLIANGIDPATGLKASPPEPAPAPTAPLETAPLEASPQPAPAPIPEAPEPMPARPIPIPAEIRNRFNPTASHAPPTITREQTATFAQLAAAGKSLAEIKALLGLTPTKTPDSDG